MRKIRLHRMARLGAIQLVLCGSLGALSEAIAQSPGIGAPTDWIVAAGRAPPSGKVDVALEDGTVGRGMAPAGAGPIGSGNTTHHCLITPMRNPSVCCEA